jgi:hypothetical protein
VAYHASFNKNLQINASGWGGYRFTRVRSGRATVEEVPVGTLVVDLVNAKTKAIVWRGTATKQVDVKASPEKREKNINKAAEAGIATGTAPFRFEPAHEVRRDQMASFIARTLQHAVAEGHVEPRGD